MSENVKRILILAANPKKTTPLRLEEEVREIDLGLQRDKENHYFLKPIWAVRPRDIRRAMLDNKPNIVHFCGHGAGEGGLAFEDDFGNVQLVTDKALSGLFELFSEQVECVILNACYSEIQAYAISKHINYVIGMSDAISDKVAIEFAVGFYDALVAGKSIGEAFKFGVSAILMLVDKDSNESLIPVLLKKGDNLSSKSPSSNNDQKNRLDERIPLTMKSDITVGFTYDCPMFYLNKENEMEGFAFELAHLLADSLNKKLIPKVLNYPQVSHKLETGEIDIAISGFIPDIGHGKNLLWSNPYLNANLCLIVHKGSALETIEDLNGITIGVYNEPFVKHWVQKNIPSAIVKAYSYPSWFECISKYEADAIINDYPYAVESMKHHPELKFANYHLTDVSYSICLPKDYELLNSINKALSVVVKTDEFKQLHSKYLYVKDVYLYDKLKILPYSRTYITKGNDDLCTLASDLLGDDKRWQEIYNINKHVIPNPFVIESGLTLYIPD